MGLRDNIPYQMCSFCILDNKDDIEIKFDEQGVCNHCHDYHANIKKFYFGNQPNLEKFYTTIKLAKESNSNSKYDVLIGLSGGVDSTYVAYLCWKNNLRALAVHLDNGWNSELSVVNIKNILKVTKFDLYTYVINWKEFRDLQRAYFKAGVVDIEVLTDHAISTILERVAKQNNIKYVFGGSSITTEGRLPSQWVHNKSDFLNIKSIHKRFGKLPLKTYPLSESYLKFVNIKKNELHFIDILDYFPYNKIEAKEKIVQEFGWRDYGGKHYESIFTRFYQGYILPRKFGIDKRKSHYSTLILANQITRDDALSLMKLDPYPDQNLLRFDYNFVAKKLGFSKEELELYLEAPPIEHRAYNSIENYLDYLRWAKRLLRRVYKIFR